MSRYLYKKIQNISPESLNFQHSGLKLTTLGSDPNVGIQIVSLINTKNRLGDYTMPWLHWGSSPDICSNWDIWTPTLSLQNRYRSSIFLLRRRTFLFLQRMWFLLCHFFMGSDPRVATGYLWNCLSEACIYPQRY